MRSVMGKGILFICAVFILAGALPASAGIPDVENHFVTDVTTVSFSAIWASSEPSTAGIEVFDDENGTTPTASATVVAHPVNSGDALIRATAEDNGVMKVMVTGLSADTTYYFRTVTTSKSTLDETLYPATSPLLSVTTEVQTIRTYESNGDTLPFSNDIIIEPCYLSDGQTPAEGTLLVATVAGGHHPVTAFVGDGVNLPNALIDLNNVFGESTNENLDLVEGKNLTLVNFRGIGGYSFVTHEIPIDDSLAEIKPADLDLHIGSNFVSFQLEPIDNQPSSVLSPIMDKLEVAWGKDQQGEWVFYRPGFPFNTMTSMHSSEGYWITVSEEASLYVEGGFNNAPVQLAPGANLVGFRSIESHHVLNTVGDISGNLDVIWGKDAQNQWVFYRPGFPFNTLGEILPGSAYWIYVDDTCEW